MNRYTFMDITPVTPECPRLLLAVRVMTRVMIFHTNHYKTLRVRDPCTRKATKDDIMLDSGTHLKVL